jgi:hypothetical protein
VVASQGWRVFSEPAAFALARGRVGATICSYGQVEAVKSSSCGRPFDVDAVDSRHARSFLGRPLQLLQVRTPALRHELQCSVVVVANPTPQPELLRPSEHEVSKADALHITTNYSVEPLHDSKVSPS